MTHGQLIETYLYKKVKLNERGIRHVKANAINHEVDWSGDIEGFVFKVETFLHVDLPLLHEVYDDKTDNYVETNVWVLTREEIEIID